MEGYQALEVIGSGSFGVIRRVRRLADGKILARKEIDYRRMEEKEKRQLVAEVNILRELRHPHIVRYYERYVDRDNCLIYIIMEYCEGGDLASIIRRCRKEGQRIPEGVVWNLFCQLLSALSACHGGGGDAASGAKPGTGPRPVILHRDIKPENILLDREQNAKLGDFGLARTIEHPERAFAQTYVGTPFYMSPELAQEAAYNTKSDVWALGCLLFELCALEPPFQAKSQPALTAKILSGRVPDLPASYSGELNRMIHCMLQVDQGRRPSIADLLASSRVQLICKERELQLQLQELRRREQLLAEREAAVTRRETAVQRAEEQLTAARRGPRAARPVTAPCTAASTPRTALDAVPKFRSQPSPTQHATKDAFRVPLARLKSSVTSGTSSPVPCGAEERRRGVSMVLSTPVAPARAPPAARAAPGGLVTSSPFSQRKHFFALSPRPAEDRGRREASRLPAAPKSARASPLGGLPARAAEGAQRWQLAVSPAPVEGLDAVTTTPMAPSAPVAMLLSP